LRNHGITVHYHTPTVPTVGNLLGRKIATALGDLKTMLPEGFRPVNEDCKCLSRKGKTLH
jgi:hypothetical protein